MVLRVKGCFNGVSTKILSLHAKVKKFHKELVDSSSRNRKRLAQKGTPPGEALECSKPRTSDEHHVSYCTQQSSSFSEHCTRPSSEGDVQSYPQMPHPVIHHSLRPHPLKRNFPRSAFLKRRRLLSHLEPARRLWIHAANAARLVATFYANILDSRTKHPSPPCTYEGFPPLPSRCLADARIRFKEFIQKLSRLVDEAARDGAYDEESDDEDEV
ncbi:hypothetical protein BC628DRAFT_1501780 [Trametes gibbosa]|nr:hypothetical protein BC628DRAFT_1504975 [Trametes gibbosa]KAI0828175.1 hypothetical protein BC628DRAFT_1501780 [Trametes gibbosa]